MGEDSRGTPPPPPAGPDGEARPVDRPADRPAACRSGDSPPHLPVLIGAILRLAAPIRGTWLDGTFGAGGYARALLGAGADRVIGIDRDPLAFEMAAPLVEEFGGRLELRAGTFGRLDEIAEAARALPLDGVVLDLGVSSMQLDRPERGFSFRHEGPLDMRMGQEGPSAADLVATLSEEELAAILRLYGEERHARRIARAIVAAREREPITTTGQLAGIIAAAMPPRRGGGRERIHPATRSFQALRIAVNDELGELVRGLAAAERALAPGGILAVVTFHSLEDRIVKRFLKERAPRVHRNRYGAVETAPEGSFELVTRKPVEASGAEIAANPRARSARLRIARRTGAPARPVDAEALGLPALPATAGRPHGKRGE